MITKISIQNQIIHMVLEVKHLNKNCMVMDKEVVDQIGEEDVDRIMRGLEEIGIVVIAVEEWERIEKMIIVNSLKLKLNKLKKQVR